MLFEIMTDTWRLCVRYWNFASFCCLYFGVERNSRGSR